MAFVSELMGRPVSDVDGENVGRLKDILAASPSEKITHPLVNAIIVQTSKGDVLVPIADVVALLAPAVPLKKRIEEITPSQPTPNDL